MRKLTQDEIKELWTYKYKIDGDILFWDCMAGFYADDEEALKKIEFEKSYLLSLKHIPAFYPCYDKTVKTYNASADEFLAEIGYEKEPEAQLVFEDNIIEKIAAKFNIDIDINGDGVSSLTAYGKKED